MAEAGVLSQRTGEQGFHGDQEGLALFFSAMAGLCTLALLSIPWLDIFVTAHARPHTKYTFIFAASANVICISSMATYIGLYRELSRRIACGEAGRVYLDNLRIGIARFASGVSFLALLLWFSGVLSLR